MRLDSPRDNGGEDNDKPAQGPGREHPRVTRIPGVNGGPLPPTGHGRAPSASETQAADNAAREQGRAVEEDADGSSLEGEDGSDRDNGPAEDEDGSGHGGDSLRRPGRPPGELDHGRDGPREHHLDSGRVLSKIDQLEDDLHEARADRRQLIDTVTGYKAKIGEAETALGRQKNLLDHMKSLIEGLDADKKRLTAETGQLESEVAAGNAERRDLVGVISRMGKTTERLEADNNELRNENASLKARLADALARGKEQPAKGTDQPPLGIDQPLEGHPEEEYRASREVQESKAADGSPDKRRRVHAPGDKALAAIGGVLGAGDAAGVLAHVLTGSETGMIAAGFTALTSLYLYGRSKYEERQERKKHADRHGN